MFCVTSRLAGSYEALDSGSAADAIVDFTGAVAESIDLVQGKYGEIISEQMKLFEDLLKVHKRGGLISCYVAVRIESWVLRVNCNEANLGKILLLVKYIECILHLYALEKVGMEKASKVTALSAKYNSTSHCIQSQNHKAVSAATSLWI